MNLLSIVNITINRYRSILSMSLNISSDLNTVVICGKNNVGKTNTLRALHIFFYPEEYKPEIDMPKIKHATGGYSTHPKIDVTFYDDKQNKYYTLSRDFRIFSDSNTGLKGVSFSIDGSKRINKKNLSEEQLLSILNQIEFVYIESINVIIPELIDSITEGMINVEYNKSRFSQSKKALKTAYDTYVDGLRGILGTFANDISQTFKSFNENWKVKFVVPKNSDTFKDLISEDVYLSLDDDGSLGVKDKGAGLQRLATILLDFEMLSRISRKKSVIICIDEPDAYLHEGLQRKLKKFIDEKSITMQLLYTTHSRVFINEYSMKNVFLLDSRFHSQYSSRKDKSISVIETFAVNISEKDGYDKICDHLGIEPEHYELLSPNNILTEGDCDKKYLTELFAFFGIDSPNIKSLNGADNSVKYLDFYESYYSNTNITYKPRIKVLLDNDSKGRECFNKIEPERYSNIFVEKYLTINHTGKSFKGKKHINNEIEDLMYPEVVVYLLNKILVKKKMKTINVNKIVKEIDTDSFMTKGIMELCEHEKNTKNPELGVNITFTSSGIESEGIKEGMAGMFNLRANKELLNCVTACNDKYPAVKEFLSRLASF